MNVGKRTEAVQFPEKKYINGIFLAVLRVEVLSRESRAKKTKCV